jgi:uncharacterized protein (DUF305 family)
MKRHLVYRFAFALVAASTTAFAAVAQDVPRQTPERPASNVEGRMDDVERNRNVRNSVGNDMRNREGSQALERIMTEGARRPVETSGQVDRDFADMMIRHHRQGIEMADVEIRYGRSEMLKAMAQKMKTQQQEDIRRLEELKASAGKLPLQAN